jgi:Ner family transcriptional regulator
MPKKPALEKDWHWADIVAAVKKSRFKSLKGLKQHYGLKSLCGLTDAKFKPYPAAERRLAQAIGRHPKDIWPSRYDATGEPKQRRPNVGRKSTPIVPGHNVNITETA